MAEPTPTRRAPRPVARRAPAIGLLIMLAWALTGCGDPDGGGGGGGGYVAQQRSAQASPGNR